MTSFLGPDAELRWANWLKLLQIPQSLILYRSPKIVTKFTRDHFFGPFDIDYLGLCTLEIRSWNDWAMIINDTNSVYSAIKRFSQHKMHKSFTPVNLVDKSAILVER